MDLLVDGAIEQGAWNDLSAELMRRLIRGLEGGNIDLCELTPQQRAALMSDSDGQDVKEGSSVDFVGRTSTKSRHMLKAST
jgi:hypothetical protein